MSSMKLFNLNYAKQNTKKSIGFLMVMFIIIPILSLVTLYNYINSSSVEPFQMKEIIIPNLMGMFILPFLLSNVLLGYVYSQKQIDFTNSMPISRKKIFFTNIIIGVVYLILMQLVTLLFSSIYLTISNTFFVSFEMLFDIFFVLTIGYIFVYIVSMLAISISGNTFMQFVIILLILFLITFLRDMFSGIFNSRENINFINADGSSYIYNEYLDYYYRRGNLGLSDSKIYTVPLNAIFGITRYGTEFFNVKSMFLTLILTIVYIVIGAKIFDKKKMESAGYSFNSTKAHLFVKILTLVPIVIIFGNLCKKLLIVQNILIIILIFAYYYVFDLITNKKIKLKITVITFIVSFMILLGGTYICNYTGEYLSSKAEKIYYDDIEKVSINLEFTYFDSYEKCGYELEKGEWGIIFDNLLDDPNNIFDFSSEVSEEVDEYVRNSYNIIVSLKLKNGKVKKINMYIPDEKYTEILKIIKNDEQFIEKLSENYKIGETSAIREISDYENIISLRDNCELKNTINNYLNKEFIQNLIEESIYYYAPEDSKIKETYKETNVYTIYAYKNHKYNIYSFTVQDGEKLNDELIKIYNKINKEKIEKFYNNPLRNNAILGITIFRRLEDMTYERNVNSADFDIYSNKNMLNFIKEDYKNDFDSEKPYYRIEDHWTGAQYYTNDVERIESILEEEINLEEVFKVTE